MLDFIHINVHSHYSIQKSILSIPKAVDKAVEDGMKGMALTDIGVMYGIKEFVDYCKRYYRNHFKPIIGCEMYVAPRTMHNKENGDEKCTRLIVLAKNLTGYKNLIKLVSDSWTKGLMGETPRTDFNELERHHEGLIICSSCLNSVISARILSGDSDGARNAVVWFKQVWGDDFYLELQRHEVTDSNQRANRKVFPLQQSVNKALIELAREYNVKLVCSNNCYFIDKENGEALDRLHCLATDKELDDPSRKLCTKQEWLKTRKEMNELFMDIPEALSNTIEILDKVEIYSIESDPFSFLPAFDIPEGFSSEAEYLAHLAYQGAKERYGDCLPENAKERLDYELDVINSMGFPTYFLFVQDYVNAAQKNLGVWGGPGRGSAVGSLVNYCLGITKIDPLKHGLLFERFINPDHISLPDIDLDFDVDGREKVIQWTKEKYGEENCAHIVTYASMATKNSIKDVARVEKLPLARSNELCKAIPDRLPDGLKMNLINAIKCTPLLQEAEASYDPRESNTIKYAKMLEGTVRGTGVHACGLIIASDAISNHVPVAVVHNPYDSDQKTIVTQYDGHVIESTGLVKFDFLGLWTLTDIKKCVHLIKQNRGIDIDIDNIPLDDEQTFKLYQEGRTIGTFQFESLGMQKYLRKLKPTVFDDLVAMNALYHPGPMDYIPAFIARKNGQEAITYDLPCMEKHLKETYGVTVYQEQIMHLVREIAGFTRGESDALRKAIGRRHWGVLEPLKERFITGGQNNGYDTHILEKIWSDWEMFGKYAFNKAHAVAYTWLAYQTAYLKVHYPAEYMAAVLTRRQYYEKERTILIEECKSMGIHVLPPSVNDSDVMFSVDKKGNILFGICFINGIYENVASEIVDKRNSGGPYKDIYDLAKRVDRSICDKEIFERLAKSGAFDCFGVPREQYLGRTLQGKSSIDLIFDYALANPTQELFEVEQPILPGTNISAFDKYLMERELMGSAFSPHPIEAYRAIYTEKCNAKCDTLNHLYDSDEYTYFAVAGLVTDIKTYSSRKPTGEEYGVITIEDESGKAEIILLSNTWNEYRNIISMYHPVVVRGYARNSLYNNFVVDKVYDLEAPNTEFSNSINVADLNKCELSVKITETQCFMGVLKPICFLEGTPQFQLWFEMYKEGLQTPNAFNCFTEIELYRGTELIGAVRGELSRHQSQRLCSLQRETGDCCGYFTMLRTQEEWEEISRRHDKKETSEYKSPFGSSKDYNDDDLPF